MSPGKPYFHPWHFSQWLSALQFAVSLELFMFVGALVLGSAFLCYSARFALQMSTVSARQLLFAFHPLSPGAVCFPRARQEMNVKGMLTAWEQKGRHP